MQTIVIETKIAAPIERCFLLSLNIDLHKASTVRTREQAIAGVTHGIIGPNQTVTWRARHFGVMLTQETLISKYSRPTHFQDIMTKGAFKSFVHDHDFTTVDDESTLMKDTLSFEAPLGPLGWLAETLILRGYLADFLRERNALIQRVAESAQDVWSPFTCEQEFSTSGASDLA